MLVVYATLDGAPDPRSAGSADGEELMNITDFTRREISQCSAALACRQGSLRFGGCLRCLRIRIYEQ